MLLLTKMATHRLDDKHDATVRPIEKISSTHYRCEVKVGLTDGSLTDSRFFGEGSTARQAESDALRKASTAISAGQIEYRPAPVPDDHCPSCGDLLTDGKALFSLRQLRPNAMWEGKEKAPELRACLKCPSCGYSETKAPMS